MLPGAAGHSRSAAKVQRNSPNHFRASSHSTEAQKSPAEGAAVKVFAWPQEFLNNSRGKNQQTVLDLPSKPCSSALSPASLSCFLLRLSQNKSLKTQPP